MHFHSPLAGLIVTSIALASLAAGSVIGLEPRDPPQCSTTTNPNVPATYVCNKQGSVQTPMIIGTTAKSTQAECRDLCLYTQRRKCISFSYGPGTNCTTYSAKIVKSKFKKSQTGSTFWNRHCFVTTCSCPEGYDNCSGQCIDVSSDENNCGACNAICTDGDTCCSGSCSDLSSSSGNCGACGQSVGEGETCCSGQAVDLQTDSQNCGACGQSVGEDQTCCGGQAVDLQTDPQNCGACGQSVGQDETCCSGQAVNLQTDAQNCASCGNDCGYNQLCANSTCVLASCDYSTVGQPCLSGTTGGDCCNNTCTQVWFDSMNCLSCGNVCMYGQMCAIYNGGCYCPDGDLGDDYDCGYCGNYCNNGQTCQNNTCLCPDGTNDLQNDNNNCGSCGNVCIEGTNCSGGSCICDDTQIPVCDGTCDTDYQNDNNNCGTCGNACDAISTCQSGVCVRGPFYLQASGSGTSADGLVLHAYEPYPGGFVVTSFSTSYSPIQLTYNATTGFLSDAAGNYLAFYQIDVMTGFIVLADPNAVTPVSCSLPRSLQLSCRSGNYYQFRTGDNGNSLMLTFNSIYNYPVVVTAVTNDS